MFLCRMSKSPQLDAETESVMKQVISHFVAVIGFSLVVTCRPRCFYASTFIILFKVKCRQSSRHQLCLLVAGICADWLKVLNCKIYIKVVFIRSIYVME